MTEWASPYNSSQWGFNFSYYEEFGPVNINAAFPFGPKISWIYTQFKSAINYL